MRVPPPSTPFRCDSLPSALPGSSAEWGQIREDDKLPTTALFCADLPTEEASRALKRLIQEKKDKGEISGPTNLLLYGLGDFNARKTLAFASAAVEERLGDVKVELLAETHKEPPLYESLFRNGVREIFIALDGSDGGGGAGTERHFHSFQSVRAIAGAVPGECAEGKLKALVKNVDSNGAVEAILSSISKTGIKHAVLEMDPGRNFDEEALSALCAQFSKNRDLTVELALGQKRRCFRSLSKRILEAESQFLDLPHFTLRGRPIPLGAVLQLNFACDQHCIFCTADRSLPPAGDAAKEKAIELTLQMKLPRVVFTGGEPTLDKNLRDYIRRYKENGALEIAVYSNGMKFASKSYTEGLVEAGMSLALISLHSHRPSVSDKITNCKGGYAKTVRGLKRLLEAGTRTIVNFAINLLNYKEAPDFARHLANEFPGAALNFSYVAAILANAASRDIVPRFKDAAPYLARALDVCDELGVEAAGLEPHWGAPPCVLGDLRRRFLPILFPLSGRYSGFVKVDACSKCRLAEACPGLREGYAQIYGTDELSAI